MALTKKELLAEKRAERTYDYPLYKALDAPGLSVAVGSLDQLLTWGLTNSLWVFPMATSCCGIELMAAAAARVDLDRMGTIVRATPRQSDVMVVAGTITVKMAPRVRKLWDQMPEPKWCIAMGSCAISGDFYRNLYSVVPGIDTLIPVDVYIPGCPPNPEALWQGLTELKTRIRNGKGKSDLPSRPMPNPKRVGDADRDPTITDAQTEIARSPGDTAGAFGAQPVPQIPEPPSTLATMAPASDFAEILKTQFGIAELPKGANDAAPLLPAERVVEVAKAAKAAGYTLLSYVVASHWPTAANGSPAKDEIELAYGLRRPGPGAAIAAWRVKVDSTDEVDSISGVFAGADWQEREQFDLVGIRFRAHPDLRRLLLPEKWEGHPLRRDYPSDKPCPPWR